MTSIGFQVSGIRLDTIFKQWTGDDSKALMKVFFFFFETNVFNFYQVYLPAIEGYVPCDILRMFRAFLEFYYISRLDVITEDTLDKLDDAILGVQALPSRLRKRVTTDNGDIYMVPEETQQEAPPVSIPF